MPPSVTTASPTLVDLPDASPTRSVYGCPGEKKKPKNLIVCIDGTSNKFGRNDTNVVKLAAKVELKSRDVEQYTYYSSGIGTHPSTASIFSRIERAVMDKLDMAVAWNMRETVQDAYSWLAQMYKEDDRIYLFGFSRGAYQVRVLAGMIHEVGLLTTTTDKQIGTAYDQYEAIRSRKPHAKQNAARFKKTFCHADVRAHFLGVWDTVSSVGLIREAVFPFGEHASHVRHALALDERRVKFIPEYFKKMNAEPRDEKPKKGAQRASTASSMEACSSDETNSSTDIKEVWFAGNHADVGGRSMPGTPFQAGNASLLWMRREAAEHGLVLKPTDVVWVPDDIDFGTSDPMGPIWKAIEYLPITHQVTFSGDGGDTRRWHRREPRCIIPGQKVHASILYGKSYKPRASLGRGFRIPIARDAEDTILDWEEALFDKTAAEWLVGRLENVNGVAPAYLDKLLFMLRFKEGKECVRNVPHWQSRFATLINSDRESLVKLVAIITLYEASSDVDTHPESDESHYFITPPNLPQVFGEAEVKFRDVLKAYKHEDGPTVFSLLRPLTKHQGLRESILTSDVLEPLVNLFDEVCGQSRKNFGEAIVGLGCLLQCENTRRIVIKKLEGPYPGASISRLEQILRVKDKQLLIPALRMVLTLARIAEGAKSASAQGGAGPTSQDARSPPKETCSLTNSVNSKIKTRLRQLAANHEGLVGLLAIEILLVLYDPTDTRNQSRRWTLGSRGTHASDHVDIYNSRVRANLCSALVCSAKGEQSDPGKHKLSSFFRLDTQDAKEMKMQEMLFTELFKAVWRGTPGERTAATKALLELWKGESNFKKSISEKPCARLLLRIFIHQLRHKEKALLAAYALARCLEYENAEVKDALKGSKKFAGNIVNMLRLNYFDDAIGSVEGFQVFKDLMKNEDLRKNIKEYDLSRLLRVKLVKGNPRETRTSLICLSVLLSHDKDGPWTSKLVEDGLTYLGKPKKKDQEAGIAIFSALAKTEHGKVAISSEISKIFDMLLPSASSGFRSVLRRGRALLGDTDLALEDPSAKSSHLMLGPVHVLCNLAQNEVLRDRMRNAKQYVTLKQLYLSETLVNKDRWYFPSFTPSRADVVETLDNLMRALDEEPEASDQSLQNIQSTAPPEIQSNISPVIPRPSRPVSSVLPLDGVMAVAILAAMVGSSAILTALAGIYNVMKLPWTRHLDEELDSLHKEQDIRDTQMKAKENGVSRESSDVSEMTVCAGDVAAEETMKLLAT